MKKSLGIVGLFLSVPGEIYEIWHLLDVVKNMSKYTATGQWNDATLNSAVGIVGFLFLIIVSYALYKSGDS